MSGVRFPARASGIHLFPTVRTGSETHQASCLMRIGAEACSLKREADSGGVPPVPPHVRMAWCVINWKHEQLLFVSQAVLQSTQMTSSEMKSLAAGRQGFRKS
jgi:hypothetical protein